MGGTSLRRTRGSLTDAPAHTESHMIVNTLSYVRPSSLPPGGKSESALTCPSRVT